MLAVGRTYCKLALRVAFLSSSRVVSTVVSTLQVAWLMKGKCKCSPQSLLC